MTILNCDEIKYCCKYIDLKHKYLAVSLINVVFKTALQVLSLNTFFKLFCEKILISLHLNCFFDKQPLVRGEGLGSGHHPGGEELVLAVLSHALHKHSPVVIVSVHHRGQQVHYGESS